MFCKHCRREYDMDDFTDESEACDDCCPDCLYSGNMFSPEEDEYMDPDGDDPYLDRYGDEEQLDESYDDIEVSDEEFDEEDITEEL